MADSGRIDLQDEVLTGEAVALDVQPIGFVLRAVGALIDVLLSGLLVLLCWLVVSALGPGDAVQRIMLIVAIVLALVLVPLTIETATRGRSLGKLAVGARVVRGDGGAITFRHACIRSLIGLLEIWLTLGGLAALVGIFTPRAQRLGDLVAGTYAERTRAPRLHDPHLAVPPQLDAWAAIADVGRLPDALARRVSRFVENRAMLTPAARIATATQLADEVLPFVSPVPHADAELLLIGVSAVRRHRELRSLHLRDERIARLTAR